MDIDPSLEYAYKLHREYLEEKRRIDEEHETLLTLQNDPDYIAAMERQAIEDANFAYALSLQDDKPEVKERFNAGIDVDAAIDIDIALAMELQEREQAASLDCDPPQYITVQSVKVWNDKTMQVDDVPCLYYQCPHCSMRTQVLVREINCTIFRCGITATGQIGQHLTEEAAANLMKSGAIIRGCKGQYQMVNHGDHYEAVKCTGK